MKRALRPEVSLDEWSRDVHRVLWPVERLAYVLVLAFLLTGCAAERRVENGVNGPETNRVYAIWPWSICQPAPMEPVK